MERLLAARHGGQFADLLVFRFVARIRAVEVGRLCRGYLTVEGSLRRDLRLCPVKAHADPEWRHLSREQRYWRDELADLRPLVQQRDGAGNAEDPRKRGLHF